jgi:hypothetical protein
MIPLSPFQQGNWRFLKQGNDMKDKGILSAEELSLIKKLCQPEPFFPTLTERTILECFKKQGIVKVHRDGSVEVTERGAERYVESKYGLMA